jgi:hypothetical protein
LVHCYFLWAGQFPTPRRCFLPLRSRDIDQARPKAYQTNHGSQDLEVSYNQQLLVPCSTATIENIPPPLVLHRLTQNFGVGGGNDTQESNHDLLGSYLERCVPRMKTVPEPPLILRGSAFHIAALKRKIRSCCCFAQSRSQSKCKRLVRYVTFASSSPSGVSYEHHSTVKTLRSTASTWQVASDTVHSSSCSSCRGHDEAVTSIQVRQIIH